MPPRKSSRLQTSPAVEPGLVSSARKNDAPAAKKRATKAVSGGKAKGAKSTASKGKKQQVQALPGSTEDRLSSLPPEILKLALDNIKDTPTINALSRTCRRLYPIMMPRLYERIVVAAQFHAHIPKLIRTLEPHLSIAQKKQLKKEGKYKGQQERYPSGLDEKARPTCASYVRQMIVGFVDPGRKHKYIVEGYIEEAFNNMENLEIVETRVLTESIAKSLASLRNLKALRLFYPRDFSSLDFTLLATIKNLKHLRLSGYRNSGNAPAPEQSLLQNSTSTLQSLVIETNSYHGSLFDGWESKSPDGLHDFAALKSLSLSNMGGSASVVKSLDRAFDFMALQELTLHHYKDTDGVLLQHLTKLASSSQGAIKLRTLNLDMTDTSWPNPPTEDKIVFDANCRFISSFDTLTTLDLSTFGQYAEGIPTNPGFSNVLLQAILKHKNLRTLRIYPVGTPSGLKNPWLWATTVQTIVEGLTHLREFGFAPYHAQMGQIGAAFARGRNLETISCFPHSWAGRPDDHGQNLVHGVLKAYLSRPCEDEKFVWEEHFRLKTLHMAWKTWEIASEFGKGDKKMGKPEVIENDGREVRARDATRSLQGRIDTRYDPDHKWANRVERQLS